MFKYRAFSYVRSVRKRLIILSLTYLFICEVAYNRYFFIILLINYQINILTIDVFSKRVIE